jgi:hypothetical protein
VTPQPRIASDHPRIPRPDSRKLDASYEMPLKTHALSNSRSLDTGNPAA